MLRNHQKTIYDLCREFDNFTIFHTCFDKCSHRVCSTLLHRVCYMHISVHCKSGICVSKYVRYCFYINTLLPFSSLPMLNHPSQRPSVLLRSVPSPLVLLATLSSPFLAFGNTNITTNHT